MKRVFLVMAAALLFVAGCASTGATSESWLNKSLDDVNGGTFELGSLKGKPTVIKVWSSWCSICLSGLKDYNELSALGLDVNVISMVEPGRGAEMDKNEFVAWFNSLDDYKNMTVLLDTEQIAQDTFFVRAYPTFVYLDENGEVAATRPGHQTNVQILETLSSIEKE